jgi:hypothetical protein
VYAYFFIGLTKAGIDVIGESQLVGFPTQYPDVSMINYVNSKPNARFWVLKMIKDNIKAGDNLVATDVNANTGDDITAQAFASGTGKKVLILNKRNKTVMLKVPAAFNGAKVSTVDEVSADDAPIQSVINSGVIEMKPFAVCLVTLN